MRQITIRQLQVFVEAAECGSFARAAERVHVTPAAISFQLKQIESMAGFALFERTGRQARLTEAGRSLLDYARIVLRALTDADQALRALRGISGGRAKLGLVSTAKYFVPHLVTQFTARHADVSIELVDANRREIVAGIVNGSLDLAIMGRPPEDIETEAVAFSPHPSVIVASPAHPLCRYDHLPKSALAGEPFIMREEGSGTRALAETMAREAGLKLRVVMTTSSNEMIKQAVMANAGIALISLHTIALETALGLVRILPVEGFPVRREWYVVHRRRMPMLPIHNALLAFVRENGRLVLDELELRYANLAKARL